MVQACAETPLDGCQRKGMSASQELADAQCSDESNFQEVSCRRVIIYVGVWEVVHHHRWDSASRSDS